MEGFKGTPGPWERGGGDNGGGELLVYCNNSLGSAICDATSHYSVFDKRTRIANLDLIAAAPELLEALQEAMKFSMSEEAYNKCATAVSKALGQ